MFLAFSNLILLQLGIFELMAYHQEDYTLVYERMEVVRTDERYVKMKTHNFKYNRTQAVTNLTFEYKIDLGNHTKAIIEGYKFASDEYRLFPIVFDRNACKSLKDNKFGFKNLYKCGNMCICPLKKGNYTVCNWSLDGPQLPPYIPSGSYMIEVKFDYRSTEFLTINVYFAVKRLFDRK